MNYVSEKKYRIKNNSKELIGLHVVKSEFINPTSKFDYVISIKTVLFLITFSVFPGGKVKNCPDENIASMSRLNNLLTNNSRFMMILKEASLSQKTV